MAATDDDADNDNAPMTEEEAIKHFSTMQQAADDRAFFTDGELASVTTALERLGLDHDRSAGLKEVLGRSAHLDYKRWHMTRATATSLANELPPVSDIEFSNAFKRVLEGGNWAQSAIYAAAKQSKNDRDRPWVVLVTGLNGVRKTTAIYEPWTLAADCDGATTFEFTPLRRRADPEGRNF